MRNVITEDHFKTTLQRNEKKVDKYRELFNVLTILQTTVTDIVFRFIAHLEQSPEGNWNKDILSEINRIVDYANECFTDTAKTYKSTRLRFNYEIRDI
jgi:hypothetical protein